MGVSKRYSGVQALTEVSLDVRAGSVHSLVGSNGAGKSTLIKIATGVEIADEGNVRVAPDAAGGGCRLGITAIYQELTIVPGMSALANVFLRAPRHQFLVLSRRSMLREFRALADRFDCHIDPDARAGNLSIAAQQVLEIMRALVGRYRVIVMDEPTASLGERERRQLYRIIEGLNGDGTAVVYISHDMDEVMSISHEVSVLRNGRLIATRPASHWKRDALVSSMLDGDTPAARVRKERPPVGHNVLSVRRLSVRADRVWNFDLSRGEILGIGGLVGSGRTSLLQTLAGLRPATPGSVTLDGLESRAPGSVRAALQAGIVLAPEDRKRQGLVLSLSGRENLSLPALGRVSRLGWVRTRAQRLLAYGSADAMSFARRALETPTRHLSGGNQQKLVIGKWLPVRPKVLLLDEPTRGIDIGAKGEIYRTIRALCTDGMSVILVSSELSELRQNCDRVLIIGAAGAITQLSHDQATVERMTEIIFACAKPGSSPH